MLPDDIDAFEKFVEFSFTRPCDVGEVVLCFITLRLLLDIQQFDVILVVQRLCRYSLQMMQQLRYRVDSCLLP